MSELFSEKDQQKAEKSYGAQDIEVLEGLEPVRKRPGMYIGGTDSRALHHLVNEILDNSMDEAVAGHANRIEIHLDSQNGVTISDNGRGIPVDEHPKFPGKSALEVILSTLHSGGKFSGKNYETAGGLHGVGISVVNALSDAMWVEVARDKQLYKQSYSKGKVLSPLENLGAVNNRRGTKVYFHPDPEIFGEKAQFNPVRLYRLIRSKAYLFGGVKIKWSCDPALLDDIEDADKKLQADEVFHFPDGLKDFLSSALDGVNCVTQSPFAGKTDLPDGEGRVEFALSWPLRHDGFNHSYCNTIPTPQGGTHEQGLRSAILKGLKAYGDMIGNKKASMITADDVFHESAVVLSVFIRDPQFQGQTKDKLATAAVSRWVDTAVKDYFDHWLTADPGASKLLLEHVIDKAEERVRRRQEKQTQRKSATRKLRLPGKLSDCSRNNADDTELFLVEGDSAGGSAKQARNRETQAVLPLRGKILNVFSASKDKIRANQEIQDLIQAIGCGMGKEFDLAKLRYERVIIMTDADVDGAHIASLLITFFYAQMRPLIEEGHLYLAQPPLYRLVSGNLSAYAQDEEHREELMNTTFKSKKKVDVSRFKGLGEMPAAQLKETTMNPKSRVLLRVTLPQAQSLSALNALDDVDAPADNIADVDQLVDQLMGKNAESRFNFIQENAEFVADLDV